MNDHGRQHISSDVARTLLDGMAHRVDVELTKTLGKNVYVLADGRALYWRGTGPGVLFPSHAELVARVREDFERARKGETGNAPLVPQGQRFVESIPALVEALPQLLQIDPTALDYSIESLDVLDDGIRGGAPYRAVADDVFPSILAYVGEVVRRAVRGHWEMRKSVIGTEWEPSIVDQHGRSLNVLRIYKDLYEDGKDASVRTFAEYGVRVLRDTK